MDKYTILKKKVNKIYNVYYVEGVYPKGLKKVVANILYKVEDYDPKDISTGQLFIDSELEKIGYEPFATKELEHFNDLEEGDNIFIGNVKYKITKIDKSNKEIVVNANVVNEVIGKKEAEELFELISVFHHMKQNDYNDKQNHLMDEKENSKEGFIKRFLKSLGGY